MLCICCTTTITKYYYLISILISLNYNIYNFFYLFFQCFFSDIILFSSLIEDKREKTVLEKTINNTKKNA